MSVPDSVTDKVDIFVKLISSTLRTCNLQVIGATCKFSCYAMFATASFGRAASLISSSLHPRRRDPMMINPRHTSALPPCHLSSATSAPTRKVLADACAQQFGRLRHRRSPRKTGDWDAIRPFPSDQLASCPAEQNQYYQCCLSRRWSKQVEGSHRYCS